LLSTVALLCLTGGCLSAAPAGEPTSTSGPETTTPASTTTNTPGATTGRPTRDPMVLDEIVNGESAANSTQSVSVAVLDLSDDSAVRTVNRTLPPDGEFSVSRPRGADHRRVVVRVDGTVVFDRTVYTAEQYWVTVHNASTATLSKAVA
jgi:outer membrane receptor protein involved in Fe transport